MLHRETNKINYQFVIGILLTFALVVLAGYVASTGIFPLIGLFIASLLGVLVLTSPTMLLLTSIVGGILIAGVVRLYMPGLELIRWGFAGTSTFLFVYVLLNFLNPKMLDKNLPTPGTIIWATLIFITTCFSSIINNPEPDTFIAGFKGYFQVWGVLFALAYLPWKESIIRNLPKWFLIIALIQLPFVLHQYFVLLPLRETMKDISGLVPIDIISGTFGGNLRGGAASIALSVFLFTVFAGVLALWANKIFSTIKLLILSPLILFPVFINSTVTSLFFFIVVLFVIFADEIVKKPLSFLSKLLVMLVLMGIMVASVIKHLPESNNVNTWRDLLVGIYGYNIERDTTLVSGTKLSRAGSIRLWLNPQQSHDIGQILFGYGIGASRILDAQAGREILLTTGQQGSVGRTTISTILWEGGVFGLICVLGLFWSAFRCAGKLISKYKSDRFQASIFQASQAGIVIFFISLFNNSYFILHIGYQTVLVVLLGYLLYWERKYYSKNI